jgi:hypothetical protein
MSTKQQLLQMVSEADRQSLAALLKEMILQGNESILAFMMLSTAAVQAMSSSDCSVSLSSSSSSCSLSGSSSCSSSSSFSSSSSSVGCDAGSVAVGSVSSPCGSSSQSSMVMVQRGSKKRKLSAGPNSSSGVSLSLLLRVSFDVLTHVLFPFLDLCDHMRVARVCVGLLKASSLPRPFVKNSRLSVVVWNKPVELPRGIDSEGLRKFCAYASPSCLSLRGCDVIDDASFRCLGGLSSLRELDISGNRQINGD